MPKKTSEDRGLLRVFALGGLHEYGKNMWVFNSAKSKEDFDSDKSEILVVDTGILYPGYEHPGIDYVMPDFSYLVKHASKIQALVLPNPHEGHIGCAEQVVRKCGIKKIIGSKLSIELLKIRMQDNSNGLPKNIEWVELSSRAPVKVSSFNITPFTVSSSAMETYALALEAYGNRVFYSGSYKIDQTPIDGIHMDMAGIAEYTMPQIGPKDELGKVVDLYIGDSHGVEQEGYSTSEMAIIPKLESILKNEKGRVIFNTASHCTKRIKNLFNLAEQAGRKIALLDRDIKETYQALQAAKLIDHAKDLLVGIRDIDSLKREEILILSSAPEGDALRELVKIAKDEDLEFQLEEGDVVVNSADPPPGMVRVMAQICDAFFLKKVKIIGGASAGVNVQNHALQEEMKYMFNMLRPKFFLPALGETRQLVRHAKLAVETGFSADSIFMLDNGDVLELEAGDIGVISKVETADVMFNHHQDYDIDEKILKDRELLSLEGIVTVALTLNKKGNIVAGPMFSAKASTFSKNKEWRAFCMINAPQIIDTVNQLTIDKPGLDVEVYRDEIRELMVNIIRTQIGKKPAVSVLVNKI